MALGVTAFRVAAAATFCSTGVGGSLFVIGPGVLFSVGVGSAGTAEGVLFFADAAFFLSNSSTGVGRWTFSAEAPLVDFLLRHCRTFCSRLCAKFVATAFSFAIRLPRDSQITALAFTSETRARTGGNMSENMPATSRPQPAQSTRLRIRWSVAGARCGPTKISAPCWDEAAVTGADSTTTLLAGVTVAGPGKVGLGAAGAGRITKGARADDAGLANGRDRGWD